MKIFESLNNYLKESFLGYTEHGEEVFVLKKIDAQASNRF